MAPAKKTQKTQKTQTAKERQASRRAFEGEVEKIAKRYPELAGEFGLARARAVAPGKAKTVAAASTKKCLAWGMDPVTGKRICLRWG